MSQKDEARGQTPKQRQRRQNRVRQMRQRKNAFGDLRKATFHPYWKPNALLATANSEVVLSCYEQDGRCFAILFNNSAREQTAFISVQKPLSPRKQTAMIYDPVEDRDTSATIADGKITVSLEPYLAKLITIP